jgi:Zinc finger, C3HC4 type (RING finger)
MDKFGIALIYDSTEYWLGKFPKTLPSLKKQVEKLVPLPDDYLFLVVHESGSKTPVKTTKEYLRALSFAECKNLELVPVTTAQDPDLDFDLLCKNSKKFSLKRSKVPDHINNNIPEAEMCVICYDRLSSPLSSKCGHVCCRVCWEKTLKNYLECPMCKSRVRLNQLSKI